MVKKSKKTKQEKRVGRMIKANRNVEFDYSEGLEKLQKRFLKKYIHSDEHIKMSEVILIYAMPLIKQIAKTPETFEAAVKYAIMVWNLGLMPEDNKEEYLEIFQEGIHTVFGGSISRENNTAIMNMLLDRQKLFFSHIKKLITGYEIVGKGKGTILNLSLSELNDPSAA